VILITETNTNFNRPYPVNPYRDRKGLVRNGNGKLVAVPGAAVVSAIATGTANNSKKKSMTSKVVSLNERRKHPRVSDALALRFNSNDSPDSSLLDPTPTHVVKMSCGGLRFVHNASVDADTNINLSMHLPSSDQTIHVASRVICSGEETSGISASTAQTQYYVQVEFLHLDTEVLQLLEDHIDYVIQKTGMTHRDVHHTARSI